jgi:hypothetical protein
MKTIKCDRCGKDIPDIPPYMNVVKQGVIKPNIMMTIWDNVKQMIMAVDLCDDCQKAIYEYIFDFGNGVGA